MGKKTIWYEVYISDMAGTRTLQLAKTISEAKQARRNFLRRKGWKRKNIYIDIWENTEMPKHIGDVAI